jgi:signal-transduction protein with cAMP-binding, CBS, and nucleotidyltransferase domain
VLDAWNRMSRTGKSRLMVVENKQLLGMLSLSDLMQHLALKFDLERGESVVTRRSTETTNDAPYCPNTANRRSRFDRK